MANGGEMYNLSTDTRVHHNAIIYSPEDLSCVPISLPDMPALSTGYNEPVAIGGRSLLDENPEQRFLYFGHKLHILSFSSVTHIII